jgi:hypothetical protein
MGGSGRSARPGPPAVHFPSRLAGIRLAACEPLASRDRPPRPGIRGGDPRAEHDSGERLSEVIPDCTFRVVPGRAHFVLSHRPDIVREALLDWIVEAPTPS